MRLIGTILQLGSAFAVYSDQECDAGEILQRFATDGESLLMFDASVRLVAIYNEAPPLVLETDISESLHDQAGG